MSIDLTRSDPLYRQILEDLREKIISGQYRLGQRLGSHRELADGYGVSIITIKRALAELMREGYLYARVGKGTFVARSTPRRESSGTKTLGVVLRDLTVPLFSEIVQAFEGYAYGAGYNVMLSMSSGQLEKEERQIERFRENGVDGLLIASMDQSHRASDPIHKLHTGAFPYVMVSYIDDPTFYMVSYDHERGAYEATTHLIDQGYRRIGYMGAEAANVLSELREQGYRRALEEHGIAPDERLIYRRLEGAGWERMKSSYEAGRELAGDPNRPDALFLYNDIAALGLQRALLEAGLRIPEDIGLVGFDDIEQASYAPVPLTTVRQSADAISSRAVEMLLGQIDQRSVEPRIVLEPELIVRSSSLRTEATASSANAQAAPLPAGRR
ncbi:MAG TPA: GntR family transcriptional regulator [Rhodothermales bacterium]